jgi:hypothetical protein
VGAFDEGAAGPVDLPMLHWPVGSDAEEPLDLVAGVTLELLRVALALAERLDSANLRSMSARAPGISRLACRNSSEGAGRVTPTAPQQRIGEDTDRARRS